MWKACPSATLPLHTGNSALHTDEITNTALIHCEGSSPVVSAEPPLIQTYSNAKVITNKKTNMAIRCQTSFARLRDW
jgi:hypothetical protein